MGLLISYMAETPHPTISGTSLWESAKETAPHPNFGQLFSQQEFANWEKGDCVSACLVPGKFELTKIDLQSGSFLVD